jgi:nucleotide-binding universal stress UspA family protein
MTTDATTPAPDAAPVLAGFDPESADRAPVDVALTAARLTGAPLVVVAVFGGAADHDGEAVEALRADLASHGTDVTIRRVGHSSAAHGLGRAAEDLQPRLLVVGATRHSGLGRVLPGSTAERVIHGSSCPVLVVPHGHALPEHGLRVIGAAFVPTDEGRHALRTAADLARPSGARVRAIMVLSPHHADEQSPGLLAGQHHDTDAAEPVAGRHRLEAEAALSEAVAELAEGVHVDVDVLFQDAADGVVAASRLVDLLVLGSPAHGPLHAVRLGGISHGVIAGAACPVLILPRA